MTYDKTYFRPDGKTPASPPSVSGGGVLRPHRPFRSGCYSKLSVVLALYGQWALTEKCLESLYADVPDVEVICVDNASPDRTLKELRNWPNVQVVRLPENRGCAYAWNAGLLEASGDVLCVLNNDTIVRPKGMQKLAQTAWETNGIAALVGGKFDTNLEFAGLESDPWEADYAEGSTLCFPRSVWAGVGEFDEEYLLGYYEDSDWGLQARLAGYKFSFIPDAVHHLRGATARAVPGLETARKHNKDRFKRTWAGFGVGERIVVVRGGGLGDVIMATPLLTALRYKYPLSRIFLQTSGLRTEYFQDVPHLDGVTVDGVPGPTRQIVLDSAYEGRHAVGEWTHPTLAFLEVAGVPAQSLAYLSPPTQDLKEWAAELLPAGPTYIACGLRSEFRPKVNWSERGWVQLVRIRPDLTFVLLDTQRQPNLETNISEPYIGPSLYSEPNVIDLTGRTPSPRHALALMRQCKACVTVDTGVLHMAASIDLPTVALFGSALPEGLVPLCGRTASIRGEAPCYPCNYQSYCRRSDGPHCLSQVVEEQVANLLDGLLAKEN